MENWQKEQPISHPGKIAAMRKYGANMARSATFLGEGPNSEFLCKLS